MARKNTIPVNAEQPAEEVEAAVEEKAADPGAKVKNCDGCNKIFVPKGDELTCPACLAKAKKRYQSSRAGYVLCDVVTDGEVVADGYIKGELKKSFRGGDRAEFLKSDVESLPGLLRPVEDG